MLLLEYLGDILERRERLFESGEGYYRAKYMMPIQRFFHRSRVRRFPVVEVVELRGRLKQQMELRASPTIKDLSNINGNVG